VADSNEENKTTRLVISGRIGSSICGPCLPVEETKRREKELFIDMNMKYA
jgi:hypothetical protein